MRIALRKEGGWDSRVEDRIVIGYFSAILMFAGRLCKWIKVPSHLLYSSSWYQTVHFVPGEEQQGSDRAQVYFTILTSYFKLNQRCANAFNGVAHLDMSHGHVYLATDSSMSLPQVRILEGLKVLTPSRSVKNIVYDEVLL
ncbi:hypothetical protein Aduo_009348 [Ancylostoma duodenale]